MNQQIPNLFSFGETSNDALNLTNYVDQMYNEEAVDQIPISMSSVSSEDQKLDSKMNTNCDNVTLIGGENLRAYAYPGDEIQEVSLEKVYQAGNMYIAEIAGWLILKNTAPRLGEFIKLRNTNNGMTKEDVCEFKGLPMADPSEVFVMDSSEEEPTIKVQESLQNLKSYLESQYATQEAEKAAYLENCQLYVALPISKYQVIEITYSGLDQVERLQLSEEAQQRIEDSERARAEAIEHNEYVARRLAEIAEAQAAEEEEEDEENPTTPTDPDSTETDEEQQSNTESDESENSDEPEEILEYVEVPEIYTPVYDDYDIYYDGMSEGLSCYMIPSGTQTNIGETISATRDYRDIMSGIGFPDNSKTKDVSLPESGKDMYTDEDTYLSICVRLSDGDYFSMTTGYVGVDLVYDESQPSRRHATLQVCGNSRIHFDYKLTYEPDYFISIAPKGRAI